MKETIIDAEILKTISTKKSKRSRNSNANTAASESSAAGTTRESRLIQNEAKKKNAVHLSSLHEVPSVKLDFIALASIEPTTETPKNLETAIDLENTQATLVLSKDDSNIKL